MWERIREIIHKEFLQTLRDPRTRTLLFLPPIIQLIIFGYAVNMDVELTKIAWMDRDRTPESRALLSAFQGSRYFMVQDVLDREDQIAEELDRGQVQAVVHVLPGYARDLNRGDVPGIQILVDGTNSNTAGIVSNYLSQALAGAAGTIMAEKRNSLLMARMTESSGPAPAQAGGLALQDRVWFNPDLKSRVYFVPGVIVNIIALVTVMLTALSIVREKEIGTMEQLMVTPLRPIELMLGKLLPFALVGILQMVMITAAALLVFGVPLRGSLVLLFASSLLFLLTTLGLGLFISTISRTQQQAMMSSFFFFMPALLLSGFAFPIRNMPRPVQVLTYFNPLRHFMEIVRGLFLKGTGIQYLWPQAAALLLFGTAILGLSALRFHKRLD
ncbi:MAG: ABC transporter permease [Acidobacteriota bacterium]|jgi:ABC-2 type transport system permease protein